MGLLERLLLAEAPARDPADERWWATGPGGSAQSGVWVGAETALQASPVWACSLSRWLSCKGRSHNAESGGVIESGESVSALSNQRKFTFSSFGGGPVRG